MNLLFWDLLPEEEIIYDAPRNSGKKVTSTCECQKPGFCPPADLSGRWREAGAPPTPLPLAPLTAFALQVICMRVAILTGQSSTALPLPLDLTADRSGSVAQSLTLGLA